MDILVCCIAYWELKHCIHVKLIFLLEVSRNCIFSCLYLLCRIRNLGQPEVFSVALIGITFPNVAYSFRLLLSI